MNLDNFHYELTKKKVELDIRKKARYAYIIQRVPYRAWFWLLICFSLYLASPF